VIWTRDESKERFPDAISPLGWSVMQSALSTNLEAIKSEFYLRRLKNDQIIRWIDGYLYSCKDFFKRIPVYHFALLPLTALAVRVFWYVFITCLDFKRKEKFKTRLLKRVYRKEIQPKVQTVIQDWKKDLPQHLKSFNESTLAAMSWRPDQPDFKNLLDKIEADGCAYNRLDFSIYFYKNLIKGILEKIALWQSEPISIQSLTSQSSFQIGKHISHLVHEVAGLSDPDAVNSFVLKGIGHLSLSWDVAQPTFSEQPKLISSIINDARRELTSAENTRATLNDSNPLANQFVQLVSCDEQHRFYASYQFPVVRKLLYKLADEWTMSGLLSDKDDLFCLTLDEIVHFQTELIAERRPSKQEIKNIILTRKSYVKPRAEHDITEDNLAHREKLFYTSKDDPDLVSEFLRSEWSGTAASPGKTQGTAFWVTDYNSLTNCPESSIVLCLTPSPNFHSAFVKAKAIVSESGGLLSHGAIIARELKLPCVLQVNNLKTIKNGDLIEIDANKGKIKRLP
jgi:phosphohistidine swiveling domain-containing protein